MRGGGQSPTLRAEQVDCVLLLYGVHPSRLDVCRSFDQSVSRSRSSGEGGMGKRGEGGEKGGREKEGGEKGGEGGKMVDEEDVNCGCLWVYIS